MNCENCEKRKEELYAFKVYERPHSFLCEKCYRDEHGLTKEEFLNEFQTERGCEQVQQCGVSQRQTVFEFKQSEDAAEG